MFHFAFPIFFYEMAQVYMAYLHVQLCFIVIYLYIYIYIYIYTYCTTIMNLIILDVCLVLYISINLYFFSLYESRHGIARGQ